MLVYLWLLTLAFGNWKFVWRLGPCSKTDPLPGSFFLTDYWLRQCGWWIQTQWPHVLFQEPQASGVDNGKESLLHLLCLLHVCKHHGAQQPEKVSRWNCSWKENLFWHTCVLIHRHRRWSRTCTALLGCVSLAQIRNFFSFPFSLVSFTLLFLYLFRDRNGHFRDFRNFHSAFSLEVWEFTLFTMQLIIKLRLFYLSWYIWVRNK